MDSSSSSGSIEKNAGHDLKPIVAAYDVDVAAHLTAGQDITVDPVEAARVRYVHPAILSVSVGRVLGSLLTVVIGTGERSIGI